MVALASKAVNLSSFVWSMRQTSLSMACVVTFHSRVPPYQIAVLKSLDQGLNALQIEKTSGEREND